MFVCEFRIILEWKGKYSKINNCLESADICDLEWKIFKDNHRKSADICDLTVTCHFKKINYVIKYF